MSDILCKLIGLGNEIGTVIKAMMYDGNYMVVTGKKANGTEFEVVFRVMEGTSNDES